MLAAVIGTGKYFWLVIFAVLCAVISVYYYFRVIQAMYFKDGDPQEMDLGPAFKGLLVVVAILIVFLGIFPNALLDLLDSFIYL